MYSEKLELYTIKTCELYEIEQLMKFIDSYWSKGHILSKNKELMDWQFLNKRNQCYNFLLAKDNYTQEIIGILGFIPTNHFDEKISDNDKYIWLANWKIRDDISVDGLGLRLLNGVFKAEATQNVGTVGNNEKVAVLYRALKFITGTMERYVIINSRMQKFTLIDNPRLGNNMVNRKSEIYSVSLDEPEFRNFCEYIKPTLLKSFPIKTVDYFVNRYLRHPFYKYHVLGIYEANIPIAFIVYRVAEYEGAYALRIVDMHGNIDKFTGFYDNIQSLLSKHHAEYADIYCAGINGEFLQNAGFFKHNSTDLMIIPNYFEPLVKKNVDVLFSYHLSNKQSKYAIFKGDSDQDRPNFI